MDFYRPTTTQGTVEALNSILRAVRAWGFYPKGHPIRRSALGLAHTAMLHLLDGNTLSLTCGRTGFSFPNGEFLKDASGLSTALAYELFIRRVQKISFFHDLFQEDLLELLRILCLSPEDIQQSGGIDAIMAARGIRTIWTNEFDLATISGKRQKVEETGIVPQGFDEAETEVDFTSVFELQPPPPDVIPPELQLQEVLGRLATCIDDDVYLILVRQAVACADKLQHFQNSRLVLMLIELLAGHAGDLTRSEGMQECAHFAIEQIVATGDIVLIVLERTGLDNEVSKTALYAVLKAGGAIAIKSAIELMGRTSNLKTRKTLSSILGSLGDAAVPMLLDMIHDPRWFITRNICAILGSISSRESLTALSKCVFHPDIRVRKEAVRSLALLGGPEAEAAIIGVLHGTDTELFPQALASLGGLRSRKSLPVLMRIVFSRDLFLKTLSLKIDALAAIAALDERQVTPHLVRLLENRHILAAVRGKQLKTAIAACLGKLGDTRALPALRKLASSSGELGTVCLDAIVQIEKKEGSVHDIS